MKMKKVAGKFGQTENCVYFCTRISAKGSVLSFKRDRDLAQLVAHTSGGREVAGSSPVIPTEEKSKLLIINDLDFFFCSFWRVFGVIMFFKPKIGHLNKDYQGKVRRTSR